MNNDRTLSMKLGLCPFPCACIAPFLGFFLLLAVAAFASEEPAVPEGESQATALADLSPEQLAVRLPQARSELVQIRREAQVRRQQIEAGNDEVRSLIREMRELRLQLQEKNKQLESLIAADEEWAALHQQEMMMLKEFRDLSQKPESAADDQNDSTDMGSLPE